ncbi:MAG: META domain-containing protein [Thermomicrobiales bacterium]
MSIIVALLLPFFSLSPLLTAATPVPTSNTIPPVVWQVIAITDAAGAKTEITEPERYTAQFLPDGSLLIQADCNRGRSSYELVDGKLVVHPGISTLALCPPESHDQAFVAALNAATSFRFDEDGLLLLSGSAGDLTMRAALEGVVWQWERFEGSDGSLVTPDAPSRYTLTFLPGGRLAVQADCNRARGTWSAQDSQLKLEIGGMTRMMCPQGSLSNDFVEDLGYVRSHVFRDGKLYLSLMADAGIMSFEAAYDAESTGTPVPEATPHA